MRHTNGKASISIFSDLPMTKDGPGGLLMRGQFFFYRIRSTVVSCQSTRAVAISYYIRLPFAMRVSCFLVAFWLVFCFFFYSFFVFLQLLPLFKISSSPTPNVSNRHLPLQWNFVFQPFFVSRETLLLLRFLTFHRWRRELYRRFSTAHGVIFIIPFVF